MRWQRLLLWSMFIVHFLWHILNVLGKNARCCRDCERSIHKTPLLRHFEYSICHISFIGANLIDAIGTIPTLGPFNPPSIRISFIEFFLTDCLPPFVLFLKGGALSDAIATQSPTRHMDNRRDYAIPNLIIIPKILHC